MTDPNPGRADDPISWLRNEEPELVDDVIRLRRLVAALDRYYRQRWKRHVSAGDAIGDRWERAKALGFGEGTSVYDSTLVIGNVNVGHDTWIGPQCVLDGSGGLTIGDWCSISAGVQIYTHDSVARALSGGAADLSRAPTTLGSNSYIGPNSVIAKGVMIGSGCVVGAASLVLADIPDGSVAYGTPARVTGTSEDYLRGHE